MKSLKSSLKSIKSVGINEKSSKSDGINKVFKFGLMASMKSLKSSMKS